MYEALREVQNPQIGVKYHCEWAESRGMVWRLVKIEGSVGVLETKQGRRIQTRLKDLREINKNIEKKAIKAQKLLTMIILHGKLITGRNVGKISFNDREHIFELAGDENRPLAGNVKVILNDSLLQFDVQAPGQPVKTLLSDWVAPYCIEPLKKFILLNSRE
jgi:hypothetical protein